MAVVFQYLKKVPLKHLKKKRLLSLNKQESDFVWVDTSVTYDFIPIALPTLCFYLCTQKTTTKVLPEFHFPVTPTDPHPPEPEEIHAPLTWVSPVFFYFTVSKIALIRQRKSHIWTVKTTTTTKKCKSRWILNMICHLHMPNIVCVFLETLAIIP